MDNSNKLSARRAVGLALAFFSLLCFHAFAQTDAGLPSESPSTFTPVTTSFDYVKRDVMIPMRDGVKLHTVIVLPKGCEKCSDAADAHAL